MKTGITILFLGFVSFAMSQDTSKVFQFLTEVNNFEEAKLWGLENADVEVSSLVVSDNSLIFNDSLFSYLGYYYLSDTISAFTHLETQEIGEILEFDKDSLAVFHKLVGIDSVLCYNVATIDLGVNYQYTDSIFNQVKESLKNGVDWNSLPYHFTDTYNPTGIEGGLGWIEKDIYEPSFISVIENHNINEVFIYRNEQGECYGSEEYSSIIYKLEKEKYFKRYIVIQVVVGS